MEILHPDLPKIIEAIGYIGIFTIVFAESGLLIGIFLPGDSLLFTAGFLSSAGMFNLPTLSVGCFIAAVLGDNVGYAFGKKVGPAIFKRKNSFWFHKKHLERAQRFYEKHGGKTIVLARFLPVVRTFAPILAGAGAMNYRKFLFYNILGGFSWAVGLTTLGHYLGSFIPDVDKYLLPIVLLIILLSLLPTVIHVLREHTLAKPTRGN